MTALRPFFLLVGRASVFWLSTLGLFVVSVTVAGLAQPEARFASYVDAIFVAAFVFPAAAGWLAGAVIQELQHTTFAWALPGVRLRMAAGFLITGVVVTVAVVGSIALMSAGPQNLPMLFVVGLGGYALGGILLDPLSTWVTSLNVVLVLFVIGSSRELSRVAGDHLWMTVFAALGVCAACFFRLFARSTFRRKPFIPTSPVPGLFSLERTRQYERRRRARDRPKRTDWRTGYLGTDSWRWVRAAAHEVHGSRGLKSVARAIGRAWGLGLLFLLYAWVDKGDMSMGQALAGSIYDALLRSPHEPQFGEHGGPYPVVMIAIAAAGAVTSLFAPAALNAAIAYPLSRRQRARVLFGTGLLDVGIFLFIVAPCLFAVGQLAGWLVGYEVRFDFMPFFFRALMVTLVLIPAAHWGRLRLQAATQRKAENTMIGVIFGVIGFVVAVGLGTFLSPRLFGSPAVELVALAATLLVSQLIYRRQLMSYYRTADLV